MVDAGHLTDWIQENATHGYRIGYVRVSSFGQNPERQLERRARHEALFCPLSKNPLMIGG